MKLKAVFFLLFSATVWGQPILDRSVCETLLSHAAVSEDFEWGGEALAKLWANYWFDYFSDPGLEDVNPTREFVTKSSLPWTYDEKKQVVARLARLTELPGFDKKGQENLGVLWVNDQAHIDRLLLSLSDVASYYRKNVEDQRKKLLLVSGLVGFLEIANLVAAAGNLFPPEIAVANSIMAFLVSVPFLKGVVARSEKAVARYGEELDSFVNEIRFINDARSSHRFLYWGEHGSCEHRVPWPHTENAPDCWWKHLSSDILFYSDGQGRPHLFIWFWRGNHILFQSS